MSPRAYANSTALSLRTRLIEHSEAIRNPKYPQCDLFLVFKKDYKQSDGEDRANAHSPGNTKTLKVRRNEKLTLCITRQNTDISTANLHCKTHSSKLTLVQASCLSQFKQLHPPSPDSQTFSGPSKEGTPGR